MNKTLSKYIEHCIIDEYADKKSRDGYSFDIKKLPKNEIENLLLTLFDNDEISRELMLDRMQELIEDQLPIKECKDKYDQGFIPLQDKNNGEIFWRYRS